MDFDKKEELLNLLSMELEYKYDFDINENEVKLILSFRNYGTLFEIATYHRKTNETTLYIPSIIIPPKYYLEQMISLCQNFNKEIE